MPSFVIFPDGDLALHASAGCLGYTRSCVRHDQAAVVAHAGDQTAGSGALLAIMVAALSHPRVVHTCWLIAMRSFNHVPQDESDEMLNLGFKDQIYDIYRYLPPELQVWAVGDEVKRTTFPFS